MNVKIYWNFVKCVQSFLAYPNQNQTKVFIFLPTAHPMGYF